MNNLENNISAIKAWLRLGGNKHIISVVSVIIVFCAFCNPVTAQEKVYEGDRVILAQNISGAGSSFYVYTPPLQIKGLYKDTTDAKNQQPEELMISILSSTSQQWENYNTLGGKADKKNSTHFANVKKMDKTKNYFQLHNKFEMIYNQTPTAIMKYYIILAEKKLPITASITMQKINGRWYRTSLSGISNLAIVLMRFQSDKMMQLLEGNTTANATMDAVIAKTRAEGNTLDFEKLMKEYASWYERKDQKMIDYFIDKNAW